MPEDLRGEALYLIFKRLEITPSVSTFKQRKQLQKLIYILQRTGISLNFTYSWYLSGPYSPSLTPYYFDIVSRRDDFEVRTKGLRFSDDIEARIAEFRKTLGGGIADVDLLEAMASLLYWEPTALDRLRLVKPHIDESTWQGAEKKLRELKLM